ncbi:hypothetical protein V6N13_113456 [Hibiscus sabdariffa]
MDDVDHVLQNCVQAQMIWREVIKPDSLEEIFSLDFKRWIRENLTNGGGFDKESDKLYLMLGGLCWLYGCIGIHGSSMTKLATFCRYHTVRKPGFSEQLIVV